ncbi:hypothetical protein JTE90_028412 [Oedothorax gibbosus]|uniref:Centromere/kinetochore protein zw10 homolog n=1 Tax=Oedothorax gibbosus TaxID=931172 RepID=A0AAV6VGR5_9ARAC|nr:hypothetical protein JTE90_028412 [Oedothorax gibbosus]
MTSLVADILQSKGGLAKEDIVLKVDDIKRNLEDIKLEVQKSLKTRYIDFFPQHLKLDNLTDDINTITQEYDVLRNKIEIEIKPKMVSSVVEFNDVVEDLKRIKKLKAVALNLFLLHKHLDAAKSYSLHNSYLDAVHSLLKFEEAFKNIESDDQKDITILSALRTEFIVRKENIIYQLETAWRERIVITSSLVGRKKSVGIKFNKIALSEEDINMLIALKLLKQLNDILKEFGKQFLNVICDTALTNIVKIFKTENASLSIEIVNDNSPDPSEAFMVLQEIFDFLNKEFFQLPTTEDDDSSSLMNELGVAIGEDFSALVIEKCLRPAIPKQSRQLESFHKEIQAAENFCNTLTEMGFISSASNGHKLLDFILEVDTLPVNKMAQDLLSRARSLMQKNMYHTVTVRDFPAVSETMDATQLNEMSVNKSTLSKSSFSFPECQVSESVKDLTKLLVDVKDEAKNIDPSHAHKLYYVGRKICELYMCVVPTYHKEEIEKLPQQTAIYHNNCMYLAHFLCTFGVAFQSEIRQSEPGLPLTFIDLVPEIRKLGVEAFLAQMRLQKQQLLQLIQEQQAYGSLLIDDSAVTKAEKAIRQCLCQLQLLKKVWADVLPVEVYFKAIGTLFNTCLEEIIQHITSMEDIAAEASAQLDCMFAILLKQGPDLFKIPASDKNNSVHVYVRRWFKFQELQIILSASMIEIVDRWASGKGPLATHFTADEVKRLIRALFQNTERRAAALAKIR